MMTIMNLNQSAGAASTAAMGSNLLAPVDQAAPNGMFAILLLQSMQQNGLVSNQAEANPTHPLLTLLATKDASSLPGTLTGSDVEMLDSFRSLADALLAVLESDSAMRDALMEDPAFQDLIALTMTLLPQEAPLDADEGMIETAVVTGSVQKPTLEQSMETIRSLVHQAETNPKNPMVVRLLEQFEQWLKPILNQAQIPTTDQNQNAVQANTPFAHVQAERSIGAHKKISDLQSTKGNEHVEVVAPTRQDGQKLQHLVMMAAKSVAPKIVNAPQETLAQEPVKLEAPAPAVTALTVEKAVSEGVAKAPETATVHARNFTEEMSRLFARHMLMNSTNGVSEAKIKLMPEHLGQLDIKIVVQQGQVTAHFTADSALGKDMLESQMVMLRSALQSSGLQVDKLTVSYTGEQQSMAQFQQQHGQRGGQPQDQRHNANASSSEMYSESVKEMISEMDTLREQVTELQNRTFEATA